MRILDYILVVAVVLMMVGCAARPVALTEPRIVTKEVRIPVPVRRESPGELQACGAAKPGFRFYAPSDTRYSSALRAEDEPKLRAWVDDKDRCIHAWQTWSAE